MSGTMFIWKPLQLEVLHSYWLAGASGTSCVFGQHKQKLEAISILDLTPGDMPTAPKCCAGMLLTEANCEDGGRTYVLAGVRCMVLAQKSVRNNRGYIMSQYVLSDTFCMAKWRDREEVYAITEDTL